jgi:cytochrome b subunit of formate dehydrogenase
MVIISFFGLVVTGLPLHFAHEPWAGFLIRMHGGVHTAGLIHRICAVITFAYFFTHIGTLIVRFVRASDRSAFLFGPNSMVPRLKDGQDLVQQFKWFFGLGPRPRFERYSYMEKFDYWAVFWGVAIIGGSGLLLWFPALFSSWLPGWVFNVATIIHGDEALLALVFIFTIHFFNGQLRPEKFPLDVVVFTGRATQEYMEEEHPLEMDRLEDDGQLEQRIAPPPNRALYIGAMILGTAAMLIGLTIAGLVIWAKLR